MTMRRNALALVAILASAVAVDAAPAPTGPPNNDAVTGVLRRVAYSDRELVVVGPGPMALAHIAGTSRASPTAVAIQDHADVARAR